ncbi:MAG TPA: serine hydrolase [Actinomycetaceae bacterium]|nr:serine hydrolase [Actinomycetaceae bacterium]
MRSTGGVWGAALGLALLLTACTDGGPEVIPEPTESEPVTGAVEFAPGVAVPDTPAGQASEWVLEQLAAAEGPSEAEASERFAEVFLAEVPADQLALVFDQLRASGPYRVQGYQGTEEAAQLPLDGAGDRYILHVVTEPDGRMSTLFLQAAPPIPEVTSLDELDAAFAELDAETSVLVADGATCEPLHARDADVARPIGSIIKLYVLDAVAEQVAGGDLDWDATLTLTDDLRSLPSGILQEEPAGHEVSVDRAAELMISISDNTATDLLIDAVGREAVLAAVERLGHHDPELLTPLLNTRALFQLGFTDAGLRDQWSAADAGERAELLAELPGGSIEIDPALGQDIVWPDGLDWFASAEDLCRAHVGLQETAQDMERVGEILAVNPGIDVPAGWDYVAFKGGSAPGEMAGSWYLESETGDPYVVVVQIAATTLEAVPDAGWLADVVGQAAEVLAREG